MKLPRAECNDILLVPVNWGHHSSVSGINPFVKELGQLRHVSMLSGARSFLTDLSSAFTLLREKLAAGAYPTRSHHSYAPAVRRLQNQIVAHHTRYPNSIIFLLCGEEQCSSLLSDAPSSLLNRAVALFHQPPSWLKLHGPSQSICSNLRAVICLSELQAGFFRATGCNRVVTMRHGVDHRFFVPGVRVLSSSRRKIMVVGQWLRDFNLLMHTSKLVWDQMTDVEFHCVVPRFARNNSSLLELASDARAFFYGDITPEELRRLYQQSDVVFLPLHDATANNAAAEAMACGLSVVCSDVGAIREYVPSGCGFFAKRGSPDAHAKALLRTLRRTSGEVNDAGKAARRVAETLLDWPTITYQLISELEDSQKAQHNSVNPV